MKLTLGIHPRPKGGVFCQLHDNHEYRIPIRGGRVKVERARGMYKPPAEAIEDVKSEKDAAGNGMLSAETFEFTGKAIWRTLQGAESFHSIHNDLYFTGGTVSSERTTYSVVIPIGEFGAALANGEHVDLTAIVPGQTAYLKYIWGDMLCDTSQMRARANEPPRANRLSELVYDLEPIRKAEADERARDVAGFMAGIREPVIEQQLAVLERIENALAP